MPTTLIQLFAKPPVSGQVKTRLIPELGEQAATAIYQYCLNYNLQLLSHSGLDYQIWLNETSDHDCFRNKTVFNQQGQNLGEKMHHALSSQLKNNNGSYSKVILLGSDCLELTRSLLHRVVTKLDHHELVLIPALDGGYVLIAATDTINPLVFSDIDWSTDRVLKQTLDRVMQAGINTAIMNPLRDIDRVEDLQHYAELKPFL